MSRYDYMDPGQNDDYCDGLAATEREVCPDCEGSGQVVFGDGIVRECGECGRKGYYEEAR